MTIFTKASDAINWAWENLSERSAHMIEYRNAVCVLVNFNPDIPGSGATRCKTDGWAIWSV